MYMYKNTYIDIYGDEIYACEYIYIYIHIYIYILFRFICTFLTKAACCRNIEIVLHTTTLSYI